MPIIAGEPPKNKGELRVFQSLSRQLNEEWLMSSSFRYASHERGRIIDREIDLLLAHPKFGLFILEIKEGVLERTVNDGWLHWRTESGRKEKTNAFDQVYTSNIKIATYVIFLDVKRPDGPLGLREQPILIFGDEVDSLLSRIEVDWPEHTENIFDKDKLGKYLFPRILPRIYTPESESPEISKIKSVISGFPEILEKLDGINANGEVLIELQKLRNEISKIPKIPPPGNHGSNKEIADINNRLDEFSHQLSRMLERIDSENFGVAESPVEVVRSEIQQLKSLFQDFSQRLDQVKDAKANEVNVDLSSVESKLNELNTSLIAIRSSSLDKKNADSFSSIQSQIGVLTARIAQLSKTIANNSAPVDKFEMKLDRLAQLYKEATDRLEEVINDKSPDVGIAATLMNEMRVMQDRLQVIATRSLHPPRVDSQVKGPDYRSRIAPSMALISMVAVFAIGAAAVASFIGNSSQTTTADLDTSFSSSTSLLPPVSVSSDTSEVVNIAQTSVLSTESTSSSSIPPSSVSLVTLPMSFEIRVKQVAMGLMHTCVLSLESTVYCWGSNTNGQLGSDAVGISNSNNPFKVGIRKAIVQIASGKFHNCALDSSGDVFCWGNNSSGQLGVDSSIYALPTPAQVVGGVKYKSISAGSNFTCGLSVSNEAWCWGNNSSNQLAANVGYSSEIPVQVTGGWKFKSIFAGEGVMTCGIEEAGRVLCWGLGSGGYISDDISPRMIDLFNSRYLDSVLSVGASHMCLVSDGTNLRCYSSYTNDLKGVGSNSAGMGLSRGTLIEPLVSLSLGKEESCALNKTGSAFCWGLIPSLVKSEQRFLSIDVYGSRKCAVNNRNRLFCWGTDADGRTYTGYVTAEPALIELKTRN